jgi:hypothetical protein
LLSEDGTIIYTRDPQLWMQPAPDPILSLVRSQQEGRKDNVIDLEGNPALLTYDPLEGDLADVLNWILVSNESQAEVTRPVLSSLTRSLGVGVLLGLLLLLLGWRVSNSISQPINLLTSGAESLSQATQI